MAQASTSRTMALARTDILKVICDYEKYPEFVDGCHKAKILSSGNDKTRVRYSLTLFGKEVIYTLDHFKEGDSVVSWSLIESNILKTNQGRWVLEELEPQKTKVTYELDLEFSIFIPKMILGTLVKSTLPSMVEGFEKRARSVYGRQ